MLAPDSASLNLIKLLENGLQNYKLVTTISGFTVDAKFKLAEANNYQLTFTLSPEDQKKGIDLDYFFQRPFALGTMGMTIYVSNAKIIAGSRGINEDLPCDYRIDVKSFKGDADESLWQQSRQKAYIKYKKNELNPYASGVIFDLKTHDEDNGFFNALAVQIGKKDFLFYHEVIDETNGFFVITPRGEIDFEQLEAAVESLVTAYGFLNGFYMRDAIYYITVKKVDGISKTSFYYESFSASINSERPILDSGYYPEIPQTDRLLSSKQFQKLVNNLYHHKEYLRSAYLLIEAATLTGCSQASLGAVALETITKKIQETNKAGVIVEDKEISRGLIYKLRKVLKDYNLLLDKEQLRIFDNKLGNINAKPNSNKLNSAFEQLSINLTKEEQDCINSRNLFLYGNLPKTKDSVLTDQELLNILANRLVMLSSMLLLKLAEFDGYVIDRGMTEVIKWRMVNNGQRVNGGNYLRNIREPQ